MFFSFELSPGQTRTVRRELFIGAQPANCISIFSRGLGPKPSGGRGLKSSWRSFVAFARPQWRRHSHTNWHNDLLLSFGTHTHKRPGGSSTKTGYTCEGANKMNRLVLDLPPPLGHGQAAADEQDERGAPIPLFMLLLGGVLSLTHPFNLLLVVRRLPTSSLYFGSLHNNDTQRHVERDGDLWPLVGVNFAPTLSSRARWIHFLMGRASNNKRNLLSCEAWPGRERAIRQPSSAA